MVANQRFEPPTNEEHFEAATRVVARVRWIDRGRMYQQRLFRVQGTAMTRPRPSH